MIEDPNPFCQSGFIAIETVNRASSDVICAESFPVTTTTGAQRASIAPATMRLMNVSPRKSANCFGFLKRAEPPAARTTAATLIKSLRRFSADGGCDCVRVTPAFTQETAHPIGQYRRHLGDDCQRDFFRRFAADVQSGWSEQVFDAGVEIERSILAESCQQFRMTFSR